MQLQRHAESFWWEWVMATMMTPLHRSLSRSRSLFLSLPLFLALFVCAASHRFVFSGFRNIRGAIGGRGRGR